MKKTLTKILLISLLFSAAVPSTMQANLDQAPWTMGEAVVATAFAVTVFTWKLLSKKAKKIKLNFGLLRAIPTNNITQIKQALKKNHHIDSQLTNGRTLLMLASQYGKLEIVNLLLENGAKVDLKREYSDWEEIMYGAINDWDGHNDWTALMHAVYYAQSLKNRGNAIEKKEANDIIELLLAAGANPLARTKDGTTALNLDKNNPIIKKFMQQKISSILNNKEFTPLPLPCDLARLTAKFTY